MPTCTALGDTRRTRLTSSFGSTVYSIEFRELCYDAATGEAIATVAYEVDGSGALGDWTYTLEHNGNVVYQDTFLAGSGWAEEVHRFPASPGDTVTWSQEATWAPSGYDSPPSDSTSATVPEPEEASFEWEKLNNPTQSSVGEQVVFTTRVTNTSDVGGTVTYDMVTNGEVLVTFNEELAPGESMTPELGHPTPDTPTWNVSVGPISWTVEVVDATGGGNGNENGGSGGGPSRAALGLLALGGGYYLYRRYG